MSNRVRDDIFLSASSYDRYDLYQRIQAASTVQLSTAQWLAGYRNHSLAVSEINLRQLAANAGRNYGSIYNMYNDLVALLKTLVPNEEGPAAQLFNVPAGRVRFALVEQGNPYAFLQAVLAHTYDSSDDFLAAQATSKVTMLRHLKPLRALSSAVGVRLHYEGMSITGDERRVRILLTLAFWLATDGAVWPFTLDRDTVVRAADMIFDSFDVSTVNPVSREVAAYYLAVAVQRICQGHCVDYQAEEQVLNYPVPNLYAELSRQFGGDLPLPKLTEETQLGESAYAYFLTNFAPMFVTPESTAATDVLARFGRYNPELSQLVTDFLDKLPSPMFDAQHLPASARAILLANLLAITVSTLTFGVDLGALLAGAFSQTVAAAPEDSDLRRKVQQTLENVVATSPLTHQFAPLIPVLTQSFYDNLRQLTLRYQPKQTVKVLPLMEQTALGYVDLYTFLLMQPFVTVLPPDSPIESADVVIQAASVPVATEQLGNAVYFQWHLNASSDLFGRLFALLRQLWLDQIEEA